MSRNVEELLRQGLDRATTGAEVPASLLTRARQHNRRRRQAIAGAVAAGTAAVTAAAVIAATAGPGTSTNALHGQTITYVTTRAEQALAHTSQGRAIERDTRTIANGSFGVTVMNLAYNGSTGSTAQEPKVLSDLHASRVVDWTYRDLDLQQGYTASGKLVFSAAIGPVGTRHGKPVYEGYGAAYPERTQWHTPLAGGPAFSEPLNCANSGFDFPSWQRGIAKALSCHVFTLAGNQEINGIDTIKLIRKPRFGIGQTLWVDPTSYLPVRISTSFEQRPKRPAVQTENFRWLPPTTSNLAALHAAEKRGAIPSGFRSLPSAYLPLPGTDTPAP